MQDRAVDAALGAMVKAIGEDKAREVVERALVESNPTDLGRQTLDACLAKLKAEAVR